MDQVNSRFLILVAGFALFPLKSMADIACTITPEQFQFAKDNAPILIQPDFTDGEDNLVPFNYGVEYKNADGSDFGKLLPTENSDVREKLDVNDTKNQPAIVDWSFVETKGAVGLYFSFFRPFSRKLPLVSSVTSTFDRNADTECGALICKKKTMGDSRKDGLEMTGMVAIGNAHGAPATASDCKELDDCLLPPYLATDTGLGLVTSGYVKSQQKGSRRLARIANRVMFVSESGFHPTAPVTESSPSKDTVSAMQMGTRPYIPGAINTLRHNVNAESWGWESNGFSKTVVYYPETLTPEEFMELSEAFKDVRALVPYKLRDKEYHEVLLPKSDELLGSNYTDRCPPSDLEPVADVDNVLVKIRPELKREFLKADRSGPSGADSFHSWIAAEHGTKGYKDGVRHPIILLHTVTDKILSGFHSDEEVKRGALVPVRNAWMREETQGERLEREKKKNLSATMSRTPHGKEDAKTAPETMVKASAN